jgi:hypothetical protein
MIEILEMASKRRIRSFCMIGPLNLFKFGYEFKTKWPHCARYDNRDENVGSTLHLCW